MASSPATCIKNKQHCCVPNCVSDGRYEDSIHFHHIPKDEEIKKQWIIKIRRDEGPLFKLTTSTVVCSKHFKKTDYKCWTPVRKRLNPGAVPSVFEWSGEAKTRRPLKRKLLASLPIQSDEMVSDEAVSDVEKVPELEEAKRKVLKIEEELEVAKTKIVHLETELTGKKEDIACLRKQINIEKFCVNRFSTDDSLILFYTGFQTYSQFMSFFECIQPTAKNMQSAYYKSSDTISLSGRKRSMLLIDELFLFVCRLRAGLLEQDLSVRFSCISLQSVGK